MIFQASEHLQSLGALGSFSGHREVFAEAQVRCLEAAIPTSRMHLRLKSSFAALLLMAGVQTCAWSAVAINESFMNATAPNWDLYGSAILTSGITDPVVRGINDPSGAGWLQLTYPESLGIAGSAIYNTAFSSTDGIQVTFTYATWGGSGADGFSFYLIDGSVTPTLGPTGGGLGYSSSSGGVTGGYLGIGFDEWGNFVTPGAGACSHVTCLGTTANSLAIRGSGTNASGGFDLLSRQVVPIATGSRTGAYRVRITISPAAPDVHVTVERDTGTGFQTLVNNLNVSTMAGQVAIPATFKMGFGASTGAVNNYHEIRGLTVNGALLTTTTVSASATCNPVTLTANVSPGTATGTVTFMDGTTSLGSGTVTGGVATLSTSLTAGTRSITAMYNGDSTNGASTSTVLNQTFLGACAAGAAPIPTLSEWGAVLLTSLIALLGFSALRRRNR